MTDITVIDLIRRQLTIQKYIIYKLAREHHTFGPDFISSLLSGRRYNLENRSTTTEVPYAGKNGLLPEAVL